MRLEMFYSFFILLTCRLSTSFSFTFYSAWSICYFFVQTRSFIFVPILILVFYFRYVSTNKVFASKIYLLLEFPSPLPREHQSFGCTYIYFFRHNIHVIMFKLWLSRDRVYGKRNGSNESVWSRFTLLKRVRFNYTEKA